MYVGGLVGVVLQDPPEVLARGTEHEAVGLELLVLAGDGHVGEYVEVAQGRDPGEKIGRVVDPAAHVVHVHHFSEMKKGFRFWRICQVFIFFRLTVLE